MSDLFAAIDRTWPAASTRSAGGWLVREGRGGGRRVSTASPLSENAAVTIAEAEAAHAALGQPALFQIRDGHDHLDRALAARGYRLSKGVTLLAAPLARLADAPPGRMTSFPVWPPLAIMTDVWAEGGIGPERLAVMARAETPRTTILGRLEDRAAGTVYVALDGSLAMVHALFILPALRRRGLARNLMRAAVAWAGANGADRMALAVEDGNAAAHGLYAAMGMVPAARFAYRLK